MSQKQIRKEIILSPEYLSLEKSNIAKGNNFIFDDEGFAQRKGVSSDESKIMFDYSKGRYYSTVVPTETYVYVDGKRAKVVIVEEWDDGGGMYKYYWFKLVFKDGSFQNIGKISFSGHSTGTNADIDSFTVYSGKGVRGSGLFFIVKKSYFKTKEVKVVFYELSQDMTEWIELCSEDMYAPTVFFNGRGESYNSAVLNDPSYKIETPQYLESRNLLTGAFKSYYTTDGYSFAFSLPYNHLTNEEITCFYKYDNETEFTWTIKAGHSFSEAVEIEGKKVTLYSNLEKGRFFFMSNDGELFCLKKANEPNNICFKAYKTNTDDMLKVASMSIATAFGGKSDEKSLTVFGGSDLYPSTVMWIDSNNPLYFPESCQTQIGDIKEKITQLTVQSGNLLAFKETQLFKGSYVKAEGYQIDGILACVKGSGNIKESGVSFALAASLPDIPCKRTVKNFGDMVIFATNSGGVYALKTQNGKMSVISPSGTFNEPLFATFSEGNYLLFAGQQSFLLWDTKELKNPVWFQQKYPAQALDAANFSSSTVLICNSQYYQYAPVIYNSVLEGEGDFYFTFEDNKAILNEKRVETSLELEPLSQDFSYNRLSKIKLTGESYFGVGLTLKNENAQFFASTAPNMLKEIEAFCGGVFSRLFLNVSFNGPFSFKRVGCLYRKLEK